MVMDILFKLIILYLVLVILVQVLRFNLENITVELMMLVVVKRMHLTLVTSMI